MILGIGTDIIEISRVRKALQVPAFASRIFTVAEQTYCRSRGKQETASFAARFAAKEAVLKALGTGLRGGKLLEIEVLPDSQGRPRVFLYGTFAQIAKEKGITYIHLSLSHSVNYAVAQAVAEGEESR